MIYAFSSPPPGSTPDEPGAPVPCPHCCGEGFFVEAGGPGRFDEHLDCWMPKELYDPCDACRGTGILPPPEEHADETRPRLNEVRDRDDRNVVEEELPF